jgi:hypothetical protein
MTQLPLTPTELAALATDPSNAHITILQDQYGLAPDAAHLTAWEIAERETRAQAQAAGLPNNGVFSHDIPHCIILEGVTVGEVNSDHPDAVALARRHGFNPVKLHAANAVSYEMPLESRQAGQGHVFIAGNERGSFFVGFTIARCFVPRGGGTHGA